MTDFHTCATCRVDLIIAEVFVTCCELLQLTGYVIGGTSIGVPIGVDPIGGLGCRSRSLALIGVALEGGVEAFAAVNCSMSLPAAKLAGRAVTALLMSTAVAATVVSTAAATTFAIGALVAALVSASTAEGGIHGGFEASIVEIQALLPTD